MPISFDLEDLRKSNDCINYLETGLFDPTVDVSCKLALKSNFSKVYSIEIRDDWVALGNEVFSSDIKSNRLTIIHGDSANLKTYLNAIGGLHEKTLFYLDAHVDNGGITQAYKFKCPLVAELDAIKSLSRNDHVICVDDVRILKENFPWGETTYGNVNFIELIKLYIKSINPNYKFTYMNGHIPNDVLVAYVPTQTPYEEQCASPPTPEPTVSPHKE